MTKGKKKEKREKDPNSICAYWKKGICRFGDRCSQRHGERAPTPEKSDTVCEFWLRGTCKFEDRCLNRHGERPGEDERRTIRERDRNLPMLAPLTSIPPAGGPPGPSHPEIPGAPPSHIPHHQPPARPLSPRPDIPLEEEYQEGRRRKRPSGWDDEILRTKGQRRRTENHLHREFGVPGEIEHRNGAYIVDVDPRFEADPRRRSPPPGSDWRNTKQNVQAAPEPSFGPPPVGPHSVNARVMSLYGDLVCKTHELWYCHDCKVDVRPEKGPPHKLLGPCTTCDASPIVSQRTRQCWMCSPCLRCGDKSGNVCSIGLCDVCYVPLMGRRLVNPPPPPRPRPGNVRVEDEVGFYAYVPSSN
eukprot:Rmarinus@m.19448